MDIANLSGEFEKYEDKWFAIDESEEKIVALAITQSKLLPTPSEAAFKIAILFKVPTFDSAFIPQT